MGSQLYTPTPYTMIQSLNISHPELRLRTSSQCSSSNDTSWPFGENALVSYRNSINVSLFAPKLRKSLRLCQFRSVTKL